MSASQASITATLGMEGPVFASHRGPRFFILILGHRRSRRARSTSCISKTKHLRRLPQSFPPSEYSSGYSWVQRLVRRWLHRMQNHSPPQAEPVRAEFIESRAPR